MFERLDVNRIRPEIFGQIGARNDCRGCPVADSAAVKKTEGPRNDGRFDHLLDAQLIFEMSLGIQAAVMMILHRDFGKKPLPFFRSQLVVIEIPASPCRRTKPAHCIRDRCPMSRQGYRRRWRGL